MPLAAAPRCGHPSPRRALASLLLLAGATSAAMYPPLASSAYSGTSGASDLCSHRLQSLYDFGPSAGDAAMDRGDDNVLSVPLPITFFGGNYTQVYISTNGMVSAGGYPPRPNAPTLSAYVALPFPTSDNYPIIAPFWADVDTSGIAPSLPSGYPEGSRVYYRVGVTRSGDVSRLTRDVAQAFPGELTFAPVSAIVVTWFAVGRYVVQAASVRNDLLNTFQVVIASDALGRSFATICLDNLVWDRGEAFSVSGSYANGTLW